MCVCTRAHMHLELLGVGVEKRGEEIEGDTKECVHRRRNALLILSLGTLIREFRF